MLQFDQAQAVLPTHPRGRRPLDWSECWLGVVSALVAAFVAALGETTGAVRRLGADVSKSACIYIYICT